MTRMMLNETNFLSAAEVAEKLRLHPQVVARKLQTGEIELHFKTAQRKGLGLNILGIADRFFRMTGTVHNPSVSVNVVGFLVHGGAAWATAGVSLVYDLFARRLTAFSNPCETVLETESP